MKITKYLFFAILLFPFKLLFPQSLETLKKDYPDSDAIINIRSHKLSLLINQGTIQAKTTVLEKKRIINELNSYNYHVENIYFNSLEKIADIKSMVKDPADYTINLEGYKAEVESTFSEGELSSDVKRQRIYFRGAKPGREIHLQYDRIIKNPYLLPIFYFDQQYPVVKTTFQITFDENIEIGWMIFNMDSIDIDFKEKESYGNKIYVWEAKNIYPVETEINGPDHLDLAPMIIPYIKSFKYNGKTHQLLGSTKDLHKWYVKMISSANMNNYGLTNIADLSKKITDTIDIEEEKIRAIFQWVQSNIKYISTNEGLGGFIPTHAEAVLKNRYGDCKAMTNLTYRLLEEAGIKSFYTWVGTIDLPFNYENNPTPSTDNHMVLAFEKKEGDYQILDATNSYGAFYDVPFYIQGKEAMISLNDSTFIIKKIPLDAYTKNTLYDSIYIYEKDGLLKSHSNLKLTGSQKYKSEYSFPLVHDEIVDYIKENYIMANAKTKLKNVDYSGVKDRSNKMEISFDYELFDHSLNTTNKKYINMNLDKPLVRFDMDIEERKTDYIFDFASSYEYISYYEIPEGFELEYMPSPKSYSHDRFGMSIQYTSNEKGIKMRRILYIKDRTIRLEDFEDWNDFIKLLKKSYTELVAVKQTK